MSLRHPVFFHVRHFFDGLIRDHRVVRLRNLKNTRKDPYPTLKPFLVSGDFGGVFKYFFMTDSEILKVRIGYLWK